MADVCVFIFLNLFLGSLWNLSEQGKLPRLRDEEESTQSNIFLLRKIGYFPNLASSKVLKLQSSKISIFLISIQLLQRSERFSIQADVTCMLWFRPLPYLNSLPEMCWLWRVYSYTLGDVPFLFVFEFKLEVSVWPRLPDQ